MEHIVGDSINLQKKGEDQKLCVQLVKGSISMKLLKKIQKPPLNALEGDEIRAEPVTLFSSAYRKL